MKTIAQALIDEVHYPISYGFVENVCIRRGLNPGDDFSKNVAEGISYTGAWADCLISLLQSVSLGEADKSVGALTDQQRKAILTKANKLYSSIGEEEVALEARPVVHINC